MCSHPKVITATSRWGRCIMGLPIKTYKLLIRVASTLPPLTKFTRLCCPELNQRTASPNFRTNYKIDMGLAHRTSSSKVESNHRGFLWIVTNATKYLSHNRAAKITMRTIWMDWLHLNSSSSICQISRHHQIRDNIFQWARKVTDQSDITTRPKSSHPKCQGCINQRVQTHANSLECWLRVERWQWVLRQNHHGGAESFILEMKEMRIYFS